MSEMECLRHCHDWDAGRWGVIIGVSRCKKCGKRSTTDDFNYTYKKSENYDEDKQP